MKRTSVTETLVNALVSGTHAEGIIGLYVAVSIEHRGQTLLVASNDDELDIRFELPVAAVLPGEHLLDALCRCVMPLGLKVDQVTDYLGHHDREEADGGARVFYFAVTAADPQAICRTPTVGHEWADLDDPTSLPLLAELHT